MFDFVKKLILRMKDQKNKHKYVRVPSISTVSIQGESNNSNTSQIKFDMKESPNISQIKCDMKEKKDNFKYNPFDSCCFEIPEDSKLKINPSEDVKWKRSLRDATDLMIEFNWQNLCVIKGSHGTNCKYNCNNKLVNGPNYINDQFNYGRLETGNTFCCFPINTILDHKCDCSHTICIVRLAITYSTNNVRIIYENGVVYTNVLYVHSDEYSLKDAKMYNEFKIAYNPKKIKIDMNTVNEQFISNNLDFFCLEEDWKELLRHDKFDEFKYLCDIQFVDKIDCFLIFDMLYKSTYVCKSEDVLPYNYPKITCLRQYPGQYMKRNYKYIKCHHHRAKGIFLLNSLKKILTIDTTYLHEIDMEILRENGIICDD